MHGCDLGDAAGDRGKSVGMVCGLLEVVAVVEFEAGFGEVDVGYMENGV